MRDQQVISPRKMDDQQGPEQQTETQEEPSSLHTGGWKDGVISVLSMCNSTNMHCLSHRTVDGTDP